MTRNPVVLSLAMALAAVLAACGQTRTLTLTPAPKTLFDPAVPIEVRGPYRMDMAGGDVAAGTGDAFGRGFVSGAKGTAGGSLSVAGGPGSGATAVVGLILAPVAGLVGGAYGAATAHSTEEVEASLASLKKLYEDANLLGALDEMVAQRLRSRGFSAVSSCPAVAEAPDADGDPEAEATRTTECEADAARNRLTLYPYYGLEQKGTYSPDLRFTLGVIAEVTGPNAEPAPRFRWKYRSHEFDFFEATKSGATLLRREIAQGQEKTADQIVEDLFVAKTPVIVTGKYYSYAHRNNFVPEPVEPGTVRRLPLHSKLVYVYENQLKN